MTGLWYRFNFLGEERFFEKKTLIDGLIVPAHIIAYYELAIPKFLTKLNLPILVDPMTYVWGIEPSCISKEGELKKSYKKLVKKFDCKIASILGEQKIQGIEQDSPEFREFVDKVLKFQLFVGGIRKTPRRHSMERIRRYREKAKSEEQAYIQPYALIPPYFYFSTTLGPAYQKTVYAAGFAKDSDYGKKYKICPCLCVDKLLLTDDDQQDRIIKDFKDYSEVILWIHDFDETKTSLHELTGFINLISKFKKAKTDVINLYGGYFSLILGHIGISKVSCGICYSRRKSVFAEAGGGGLPVRYYEPHLKIKLLRESMFKLYSDSTELFACDCPICSGYSKNYKTAQLIADKEALLSDFFGISEEGEKSAKEGVINWEKSRLHFLHARKIEQNFSNNNTLDEVVSDLRKKYDSMVKNRVDPNKYGFDSFEHLRLWADSLQESK